MSHMRTPRIGDLVLITVEPGENNGSPEAAGRVVKVFFEPLAVNVRADLDAQFPHQHPSAYQTQVPFFESKDDMLASGITKVGYDQKPHPYGAYWPSA